MTHSTWAHWTTPPMASACGGVRASPLSAMLPRRPFGRSSNCARVSMARGQHRRSTPFWRSTATGAQGPTWGSCGSGANAEIWWHWQSHALCASCAVAKDAKTGLGDAFLWRQSRLPNNAAALVCHERPRVCVSSIHAVGTCRDLKRRAASLIEDRTWHEIYHLIALRTGKGAVGWLHHQYGSPWQLYHSPDRREGAKCGELVRCFTQTYALGGQNLRPEAHELVELMNEASETYRDQESSGGIRLW